MKAILSMFTAIALMLVAMLYSASGESARMGWQTTTSSGSYVSRVHMTGPTAWNKYPEKKGVFKGVFFSREGEWQSKLTAIYKMSLDKKGDLQSQKVQFTLSPASTSDIVETNGVKMAKTQFETENLLFEPEESFVLVFKTKIGRGTKDGLEMVMVRITHVFVPS